MLNRAGPLPGKASRQHVFSKLSLVNVFKRCEPGILFISLPIGPLFILAIMT